VSTKKCLKPKKDKSEIKETKRVNMKEWSKRKEIWIDINKIVVSNKMVVFRYLIFVEKFLFE